MNLPFGFDRADGVTPLPPQPLGAGGSDAILGTPVPEFGLQSSSNNGGIPTIENDDDSPTIERAEQATSMGSLKMSWTDCLNYIPLIGRGTFVQDSFGNVWRILSSKIQAFRSGQLMGKLSYTAESISFDSPPDDYQMIPVELGIDILKHPRYAWALIPYVTDQSTFAIVGDTKVFYTQQKSSIVRAIQSYRDAPVYMNANLINGLIQDSVLNQIANGKINVPIPNPNYVPPANVVYDPNKNPTSANWDGLTASLSKIPNTVQNLILQVPVNIEDPFDPITIAIAAAKEIISKLWRQEDNPYVVGFQVTWSQYYFAPVYENPGGYQESPVGIVNDFFLSPSQDGSNTIFDQIAAINPQSYSSDRTPYGSLDISWLRKADEVEYQRTWFKVTRTWVGSPIGHWDNNLYLALGEQGPQNANDFNQPA